MSCGSYSFYNCLFCRCMEKNLADSYNCKKRFSCIFGLKICKLSKGLKRLKIKGKKSEKMMDTL